MNPIQKLQHEEQTRELTRLANQYMDAWKEANEVADTLSTRIAELEAENAKLKQEVVELTHDCLILAADNRERRHKMSDMEKTATIQENTIARLEKENTDLGWKVSNARDEMNARRDEW